jgi:hypothetical protein
MDYPPSATVPVYTDKVFVKALRIPKIADEIKIKGSEIYKKSKNTSKPDRQEIKEEKPSVNQNQSDIFGLFGSTTSKTVPQTQPTQQASTNLKTNNNNFSQNSKPETVKNPDIEKNNEIFQKLNLNLIDNSNTKPNIDIFSNNNEPNQFEGFEFTGFTSQSENFTKQENTIPEEKNNSFIGFNANIDDFKFVNSGGENFFSSKNEDLNKSYQEKPNYINNNNNSNNNSNNNMKGSSKF